MSRRYIVVVTGGRDYADRVALTAALERIHGTTNRILLLVHGNCTGADAMAEQWAKQREVPYLGWPAPWTQQGRAAGPKRNRAMLRFARMLPARHVLVAFPGGTGTADCVAAAQELGLPVVQAGDLT